MDTIAPFTPVDPPAATPNRALWEKGDFTRIADSMRTSGEDLVDRIGIPAGTRVLDLGCGDGTTAIPAAERGAVVLGVDIAENLVAAGRRRAQAHGLTTIRFENGDARDLSWIPDDSFDTVVSVFGAMFAPEPETVAAEMVRVTRPGGRIVMGNWIPGDPTLVAQILKISGGVLAAAAGGLREPDDVGRPRAGGRAVHRGGRARGERHLRARHVRVRDRQVADGVPRRLPRVLRPDDEHVRRRRRERARRRALRRARRALPGAEPEPRTPTRPGSPRPSCGSPSTCDRPADGDGSGCASPRAHPDPVASSEKDTAMATPTPPPSPDPRHPRAPSTARDLAPPRRRGVPLGRAHGPHHRRRRTRHRADAHPRHQGHVGSGRLRPAALRRPPRGRAARQPRRGRRPRRARRRLPRRRVRPRCRRGRDRADRRHHRDRRAGHHRDVRARRHHRAHRPLRGVGVGHRGLAADPRRRAPLRHDDRRAHRALGRAPRADPPVRRPRRRGTRAGAGRTGGAHRRDAGRRARPQAASARAPREPDRVPSPRSWARPPTGPGCAPNTSGGRPPRRSGAARSPSRRTTGGSRHEHGRRRRAAAPGMEPRSPGVSRHRPHDHRRRADRDRHRRHDQHVAGPRARRMGGRAVDRRRCRAAPHHPDARHRERAVRDRRVGRARQRPGDRVRRRDRALVPRGVAAATPARRAPPDRPALLHRHRALRARRPRPVRHDSPTTWAPGGCCSRRGWVSRRSRSRPGARCPTGWASTSPRRSRSAGCWPRSPPGGRRPRPR